MKRLIVLTSALALGVACSNPSASAANNFAASNGGSARPVATSGNAGVDAAAVAATSAAAPATPASETGAPAEVREVTLPAGTVLPIDLETSVGSDISRVEQPVHGRLRRAVTVRGVEVLPAGTGVSGHVTAVRRPGRVKGRGYVAMRF